MTETGQWKHLLKVEMMQKYGINEARYSKDKARKRKLYFLGVSYFLLGAMLVGYICLASFGLCLAGVSEILMPYLFAGTSVIIFFFSVFRAGNHMFQMETYEMLIALPVSVRDIVMSRFLSMYIGNFVISALVMLSGCIVYTLFEGMNILYWIMILVGIVLLPLFPILAAMVVGSIITGIGARMKHKNLVTIILSMLFVVGILMASFMTSYLGRRGEIGVKELLDMTEMLKEQVNHMYLFAPLFTKAVMEQDILAFMLFVFIYFISFVGVIFVLQKYFSDICNLLSAHKTKGNYKMGGLKVSFPIIALYKKEWKRYLSSNAYVMNTAVGYLMMLLLSVGGLVMGSEKIEQMLGIGGSIEVFAPFVLAWLTSISAITASSISMEGKNWWLPMSLPVSFKQIIDSKILVHLTLAIPSCLFASILLCLGIAAKGEMALWIIVTPLVYSLFTAVSGIWINVKIPLLTWKNETDVVKQSGASFFSVILSFLSGGIPVLLLIFGVLRFSILMPVLNVGLLVITVGIYYYLQQYDARKIGM